MREGEPYFEEDLPVEKIKNEPALVGDTMEPQLDLLDRKTSLTIEEISKIRTNKHQLSNHPSLQRRDYKLGGTEISVINQRIYTDDPEFKKNREKIDDMTKSKEKGEVYPFERVIVNALFEQASIAKAFNIPTNSSFKLDFTGGKTRMMDNHGFVNVLVLREQINSLKRDGATDEQVITEISGHMFHEALHMCADMESGLLRGKTPAGEFTSITGQLAYYIAKGYSGPSSYDNDSLAEGVKKVENDNNSIFDYDVATLAAAELILEQLQSTYPEVAGETKSGTALDACETIVAKLSEAEGTRLIPCLREAILQSTSEEIFDEIVNRLKTQNSKNK